MTAQIAVKPEAAEVLTRAVVGAARQMGISQARLASILGLSTAVVSRIFNGQYVLDPKKSPWDSAATLVLIYRSLASIVGSNTELIRSWLHTTNNDFGEVPLTLMLKPPGLYQVRSYLDAYRGRC